MADVKISGLPSSSGIADTTLLPTVSAALATEKATGLQLKTYVRIGTGIPIPTVLLTGTAQTYTTPTDANGNLPTRLEVELQGPGSGGAGSGTTPGAVSAPVNDTTFGALTAAKGAVPATTTGGAKVTATGGDDNIDGQKGGDWPSGFTFNCGGFGGGIGGGKSRPSGAGDAANPNSGGGGGGAGSDSVGSPGGGGGGGAWIKKTITSPAASYLYTVGLGSNGGTAGTSGFAGGRGGDGKIKVTPYWV